MRRRASGVHKRALRCESLEVRDLLAVYAVTNLDDSGPGSLRFAIMEANFNPGADTIEFHQLGTILLTSGEIEIYDSLLIDGPGADELVIDAGNGFDQVAATKDGFRIFSIYDFNNEDTIEVEIRGVCLQGGDEASIGGAIWSREKLLVSDSTIRSNACADYGGGIAASSGEIKIVRTSVIDNQSGGNGGGILVSDVSSASISSCTISGNKAGGYGGGIFNAASAAQINVEHCTVVGNQFLYLSGGSSPIYGGGIFNESGSLTLNHTIVADNRNRNDLLDDVYSPIGFSAGYSLIGRTVDTWVTNTGGSLIGSVESQIDALVGPLANNGGPMWTHALLPGSPAIDAGDPMFDSVAMPYDQRGVPYARVVGGRIDIGAVEMESSVEVPELLGDYNRDNVVDAVDYTVWRNTLGTTGLDPYDGADGSGNGEVGPDDYGVWKEHYGEVLAPGAGGVGLGAGSTEQGVASGRQNIGGAGAGGLLQARLVEAGGIRSVRDYETGRLDDERFVEEAHGDQLSRVWLGLESGDATLAGSAGTAPSLRVTGTSLDVASNDAALLAWLDSREMGRTEPIDDERPVRDGAWDEAASEDSVGDVDAIFWLIGADA